MLKSLRINNIVLIEEAVVPFTAGFNVLTGETGSGKSAIMGALNYIAGARSNANILRHDTEKGSIEAAFDIDMHTQVHELLKEAGIEHETGEELIIRREITRTGKSRAFVNNQLAHINFLKKIGENLLEIVGQHANQRLISLEQHREILDLFGDNQGCKKRFKENWQEECRLIEEYNTLKKNEAQRLRQIVICQKELEELDEVQLKENEDEELFKEYSRLTHSEELAKYASDIYQCLAGDNDPIISSLNRLQHSFNQLITHDSSLKDSADAFKSAIIEIQDVADVISNYQSAIEYNPQKIEEINERLTLINKLKRKFGPSISDVIKYQEDSRQKLFQLENADFQIEELEKQISKVKETSQKLASELTARRKKAGTILEKEMKEQLHALNMQKAIFYVSLFSHSRTSHGDESVEFFFAPNVGEKKISIKECASGGELSRIMLALQTLLAGKEKIPTLVFDEIDSNIGGETAAVVGEKLREIGRGHQVLCITHFPQVATCAQHHLQITKCEKEGRTFTEVHFLDSTTRKKELDRMSGNSVSKLSKAAKTTKKCEDNSKSIGV
jgi:DNA repair protein RecN (Recombination protein N)